MGLFKQFANLLTAHLDLAVIGALPIPVELATFINDQLVLPPSDGGEAARDAPLHLTPTGDVNVKQGVRTAFAPSDRRTSIILDEELGITLRIRPPPLNCHSPVDFYTPRAMLVDDDGDAASSSSPDRPSPTKVGSASAAMLACDEAPPGKALAGPGVEEALQHIVIQ